MAKWSIKGIDKSEKI